jgi:hypothetical protein
MGIDVRPQRRQPGIRPQPSRHRRFLDGTPLVEALHGVDAFPRLFRPSKPSDDGEKPQRCAATVGDAVWRLVGRKSCAGSSIGSSIPGYSLRVPGRPVPRLESLQLGRTGARRCPRRRRPRRPRRSHCRSAYEARERERLLSSVERRFGIVCRPQHRTDGGDGSRRPTASHGRQCSHPNRVWSRNNRERLGEAARADGSRGAHPHDTTNRHRDGCSAGDRHSATRHGHGPAGDGYRRRDGEM